MRTSTFIYRLLAAGYPQHFWMEAKSLPKTLPSGRKGHIDGIMPLSMWFDLDTRF